MTLRNFGNDFGESPILSHFWPFLPHQKSHKIHLKNPKTLENKPFLRTLPKITTFNKETTPQSPQIINSQNTKKASRINVFSSILPTQNYSLTEVTKFNHIIILTNYPHITNKSVHSISTTHQLHQFNNYPIRSQFLIN